MSPTVSIIIPCYNEETTIQQVIQSFRHELPHSTIIICDNNSDDNTAKVAKNNGAIVLFEKRQGKGHAVRRLFRYVQSDITVMVDGDNTYDPKAIHLLIQKLISENLDMVCGSRKAVNTKAYRFGHSFGNRLFNHTVSFIFGKTFTDIFTGYRAFSHRFISSFPSLTNGFDIETELSVHSLQLNLSTTEIPTNYFNRPEGSYSKLSTIKDGFLILSTIFSLLKNNKPNVLFNSLAILSTLFSFTFFMPILSKYIETGLVERLPTAILSGLLMIVAFIFFSIGLILQNITSLSLQHKNLCYLNIPRKQHDKEKTLHEPS
ncbi:MAG TPA: glycosyltransferase [Gammaproteobacteria bacterium]|nr:glycosyltransferase [Gammaproteobacteria bacterium]